MHIPRLSLPAILLAVMLGMASCKPSSPAPEAPRPAALKVTVLPILEALPMYVAQQQGYFAARGVAVEVITASSAPERDQLIASGQVDGMVNELLGAILYNREQIQVQVVRYARTATSEAALFRILASKQSNIATVEGLKHAPIGISQGTIIDYLTTRLLEAEGFKPEEIKTVAVPRPADRVALLNSGELKAGMFPEPQAALTVQQGAVPVLDDTRHPRYSFSVLTFRSAAIDQRPQAVRAFLAAWEDAVKKINEDPSSWRSLLVDKKMLPAPLAQSFQVPSFATLGVPSAAQYQDMADWAKARNLTAAVPPYERVVNASFLPR